MESLKQRETEDTAEGAVTRTMALEENNGKGPAESAINSQNELAQPVYAESTLGTDSFGGTRRHD